MAHATVALHQGAIDDLPQAAVDAVIVNECRTARCFDLDKIFLINYKNEKGEKMDSSTKRMLGFYYPKTTHLCA